MIFKFPKDSSEYYTKLSKLSKEDLVLNEENDFRFIVILNEIEHKIFNLEDIATIGQGLGKTYVRLGDVIDIIEKYLPEGEELEL